MLGTLEIVLIFVAILLLFGPDKIPELMRSAGIAMAEFKKAEQAARLSNDFDTSGFDKYNREYRKQKKAESAALFEKVKSVAEESGIPTEGKSMDELLVLIEEKANAIKENNSAAITEESGDSKDLATENVTDAVNENTYAADSANSANSAKSADSTDLLNPAASVSGAKSKDAEIEKSSIETSSENAPKSRSYSGFGASDPAFASFVPGNSNSAAPAFSIPSAASSVHSGLLADIELAFGSGSSGSPGEQSGSSDSSDASDSTDSTDLSDSANESASSVASASEPSPLSLYDLNRFESASSASPRPSSGLLADVESAFGKKDSEDVSASGNVVESVD